MPITCDGNHDNDNSTITDNKKRIRCLVTDISERLVNLVILL